MKQQENCSRLTFTETVNYQMKKTYKDTLCTYEHMQEKKGEYNISNESDTMSGKVLSTLNYDNDYKRSVNNNIFT